MNSRKLWLVGFMLVAMVVGFADAKGARKEKVAPGMPLNQEGTKLLARYSAQQKALQADIMKLLPAVATDKKSTLQKARDEVQAAEAQADAAQKALSVVNGGKALVEHAKGKWIGGAEKDIAKAQSALKSATTDAAREAAKKDLAAAQANKEAGLKALKERQAAWDKARADEPKLLQANQQAQAALARAKANVTASAKSTTGGADTLLSGETLDAKLVKCAVLTDATPHGLAEFAQAGKAQEALVEKLLADDKLMKEMLVNGGAAFGKYGQAMEIYAAIQKASPKASQDVVLKRLALATSLEHATPVGQSNAKDQTGAPAVVDPVKRYLHYEKAYLDGELDPAFKTLNVWEYRMVVDCDAPDSILAWGRRMLQNYRPDHIYNPNYGWRYVASVKTEVPYGSQNVDKDLPSLQQYQNIIKDGGVCGRRAFFGRFILRSFGIPVWGVTQKAHAALSHWTPNGWVVNLGAGYQWSWWDKDEVSLSGSDFLLETQARAHPQDYMKVLRMQWISMILGEEQYNDRKKVPGGFWSAMAHEKSVEIAAKEKALGPLGQELAEANESREKQIGEHAKVEDADRKVAASGAGVITIPAVAFEKPTGKHATMKSFSGGLQLHALGGFGADYAFTAQRAGKYALAARLVTVQEGQKAVVKANSAQPTPEIAVPYTIGEWKQAPLGEITLAGGKNVVNFALVPGSRGVTIKEFTLTPVK